MCSNLEAKHTIGERGGDTNEREFQALKLGGILSVELSHSGGS